MSAGRRMASRAVALLLQALLAAANVPLFDVATSVRVLMVPLDARSGSAIYRLRATDADFDFPLRFLVVGGDGVPVVSVESYPCTRNHSFCEGSVLLLRPLESGRVYDVQFQVVDAAGDSTTLDCTIKAANSTTPTDTIFPHLPQLVTVPEDATPGTELDYIIARRNPLNARHPSLEIRGATEFVMRQALASNDTVNGTIILAAPLDFEKKSMYILQIFAVDPYAEPGQDTRNVASIKVAVAVQDVQDMPPVFTQAPAVTLLGHSVHQGDVVLTVHAEDGDKGDPRQIRYGLVSEGSPFASFFLIDERTGEVRLSRPLRELAALTHAHQPVLLTVVAEEVKTSLQQPPAATTAVQLALLLGDMGNSPPYFENDNYVARIQENSPQGTALTFGEPYITEIRDDDMGKSGVFSISLENNNGTFEVSPTVGERRAAFVVCVRSTKLLDFEERSTLHFTVVARELGPGRSLSSSALVVVYLEDANDNAPVFARAAYEVTLPENMTAGTTVAQVRADDADAGLFGEVQYTQVLGHLNTSLTLDSITGLVTVSRNHHRFDRETAPEFRFHVEARDAEGAGNRALAPLVIKLLDVNDETPRFDRDLYEFFLTPSQRNFTAPAFVAAVDKDAEAPNNVVRYEIISGNYANKFRLDEATGQLTVRSPPISSRRLSRLKRELEEDGTPSAIVMTARAYDLGVPHRWSTATVHVLPPSANTHTVQFIVNGSRPDVQQTLAILRAVTGGDVRINSIRPYDQRRLELSELFERQQQLPEKSIVEATVLYDGKATVDISELQRLLQTNATTSSMVEPVPKPPEDRALFWILMILAVLIVITVLLLLLCCVCPCCPLYVVPKKNSRVNTAEEVHVLVNEQGRGVETKGVQAEWAAMRREAWSGDQKTEQWHFNRRNQPHREAAVVGAGVLDDRRGDQDHDLTAAAAAAARGPAVVYTRELQQLQQSYDQRREVYLEDLDTGEYPSVGQILDVRRRPRDHDADTDSMRQHEAERGSDLGRGTDGHPQYRVVLQRTSHDGPDEELGVAEGQEVSPGSRREQFYIRDGNAEILRLVTRGRSVEDDPRGQQEQRPARQHGKEILMQRFIEDQRKSTSGGQQETAGDEEALRPRQQELLVRRLLEEEDEARAHLGNVRLLNEALLRHRGTMLLVPGHDPETQSLPGQASMATQTDVDSSTQTDPLRLMRPPRRRAKSDNDESYTDGDDDQQAESINTPATGQTDNSWLKRRKSKKRRQLKHRGEAKVKRGVTTKRHKIKTPIIEETESALETVERQSSNSKSKESSDSTEVDLENNLSLRHKRNDASTVHTTAGEVEVTELTKKAHTTYTHSDIPSIENVLTNSIEDKITIQKGSEETATLKVPENENLNPETRKINSPPVGNNPPESSEKEKDVAQVNTSEPQHITADGIQTLTAHNENLLSEPISSPNPKHQSQSNANQYNSVHKQANEDSYVLKINELRDYRSHVDDYRRPSSRDLDPTYNESHYYSEDNRGSYSRERRYHAQHERQSRSRSRRMPEDIFWYEFDNSPSRDKYGRIRPHSIDNRDNRHRSGRRNEDDYVDGRYYYETDREEWISRNSFDDERPRGRYRTMPYETARRYRRHDSRSHGRERHLRDRRISPSPERDYYERPYHRSRSRDRAERKYSRRSRSRYREESPRMYLSRYRRSPSRRALEDDEEWYYDTRERSPRNVHKEKPRMSAAEEELENTASTAALRPEVSAPRALHEDRVPNEQASKDISQSRVAGGRGELKQSEEALAISDKATNILAAEEKEDVTKANLTSTEKFPRSLISQLDDSEQKASEVETVSTQVSPQRTLSVEKQSAVRYSDQDDESPQFVDSLEHSDEVKRDNRAKNKTQAAARNAVQATSPSVKDRSRQRSVSDVSRGEKTRARRQSASEPARSDKDSQQAGGRTKSMLQVSPQVEEHKPHTLPNKKGSRYMEWYKTKKEEREKKKREEEENKKKEEDKKKSKLQRSKKNVFAAPEKPQAKEDIPVPEPATKKNESKRVDQAKIMVKNSEDAEEEKLGELQTLKVAGGFEDDMDSGIAMSSLPPGGTLRRKKHHQLMEKKSIFTIAYDDMQTQQIRADSTSPPY